MPNNTQAVQTASDAFGRGDIPAVLDLCAGNVEVTFTGDPSILPFAGKWKGKDRVAEYFRTLGETLDVLKWEPRNIVASGNRVVAFYAVSARVKATGKTLADSPVALDFTAENGKVTGWQVYSDTAAMEKAFTGTSSTASV